MSTTTIRPVYTASLFVCNLSSVSISSIPDIFPSFRPIDLMPRYVYMDPSATFNSVNFV